MQYDTDNHTVNMESYHKLSLNAFRTILYIELLQGIFQPRHFFERQRSKVTLKC